MIVIVEIFLLILACALGLGALIVNIWNKPDKPARKKEDLGPDFAPERSFRTHGIAKWWFEHGCPSEIGTQVEVNMKSGRVGIYELKKVEPALGVDWSWYDFEFVRYKDAATGPQDGPVYPRD